MLKCENGCKQKYGCPQCDTQALTPNDQYHRSIIESWKKEELLWIEREKEYRDRLQGIITHLENFNSVTALEAAREALK